MIELRGISRNFPVGDQVVHALRGIDLSVSAGEYLSIMGPSGSGKSTLLHVIGLLDRPDAGVYTLDSEVVTTLEPAEQALVRRDKIGFVFQFFHLVPRLTAAENIELPMVLAGIDPEVRGERVRRALGDFGILERSDHRPAQLSGGQRQRVAIARATIMGPRILLADEPTGNLDRSSGHEVLRILEELHHNGLTLMIVTHDPEIGERAHRRIRVVDGSIEDDEGTS